MQEKSCCRPVCRAPQLFLLVVKAVGAAGPALREQCGAVYFCPTFLDEKPLFVVAMKELAPAPLPG